MTEIKALYVYTESTFKTNTSIEDMHGMVLKPGAVTLARGAYRTAASADVTQLSGRADIRVHQIVIVSGRKTIVPDPPGAAPEGVGQTAANLTTFFSGAGDSGST